GIASPRSRMTQAASGTGESTAPDAVAVTARMTPKALWTLAITSVAVFMVTLDNLVVTTAIPVIREDLHASLSGLQWTVNAYTLTFAVLLLTGAALGDRFGRRRLLAIGIAIFTAASAAAALSPSIVALDVARAAQGVGAAHRAPDAPDALLRQPDLRVGQHRQPVHVLRDVRLDLLHLAVLPGRAGPIAVSVGAADPAVDGDADARRADRRRGFRSHRRPSADGSRAGLTGHRPCVDRGGLDADDPLRAVHRPVRPLGRWHGAVLRARGQRHPVLRAPGRGRTGIGRQQRDPRARRRVRRSRA